MGGGEFMSLLFSFRPLVINPELARRIGLNEAIVLQQMNYWLMETDSGVTHDGRRWIYNTHEQWNDQFPFWSQDTVKRAITSLKKQGILRVEKLNKGRCDHTNFYTINYDAAALIEQCNMPPSNDSKLPPSNDSKLPPSENDGLPSPNSANCPHLTESTTDTPPENPGGSESKDIQSILERFYRINPSLSFGKKPERDACRQLLKKHKTIEETLRICDYVLSIQGQPFAPVVTSPLELWKKYAKVAIFHQRDTKRNNNVRQA